MTHRVIDQFLRATCCFPRMGVLALVASVLLAGCVTVAPPERAVVIDEAERVFVTLSSDFEPVQVGNAEFTGALTQLLVEMPLRVAPATIPMQPGRRYALASEPVSRGETWHYSELARSYGRFCERRGTPGDCLSLFEDGSRLQSDDKRRIALALAVVPALEGVDAEVRSMLNPSRVVAMASITLTAYIAYSGHRDHPDRSIVITWIGHRDRSEATLTGRAPVSGPPRLLRSRPPPLNRAPIRPILHRRQQVEWGHQQQCYRKRMSPDRMVLLRHDDTPAQMRNIGRRSVSPGRYSRMSKQMAATTTSVVVAAQWSADLAVSMSIPQRWAHRTHHGE
ncbi:hypothetical protein JQX13_24025 [Archangium violaceum]|nr:hypothetical protein JQX13_24025 [Archangium violaceum]